MYEDSMFAQSLLGECKQEGSRVKSSVGVILILLLLILIGAVSRPPAPCRCPWPLVPGNALIREGGEQRDRGLGDGAGLSISLEEKERSVGKVRSSSRLAR